MRKNRTHSKRYPLSAMGLSGGRWRGREGGGGKGGRKASVGLERGWRRSEEEEMSRYDTSSPSPLLGFSRHHFLSLLGNLSARALHAPTRPGIPACRLPVLHLSDSLAPSSLHFPAPGSSTTFQHVRSLYSNKSFLDVQICIGIHTISCIIVPLSAFSCNISCLRSRRIYWYELA